MANAIPLPDVSATPRASDFMTGLLAPFRAMALVRRTPRLQRLARWMAVVTAISLVAIAWLLFLYADDLVRLVWTRPEHWAGSFAWALVVLFVFLALFAIGATIVPPLLLTPLQDPLSETVEALATGHTPPAFSVGLFARSVYVGLRHTLARILIMTGGLVLLLPLNLIPGIGSLAYTVLATIWSAVWLAGEHLGAPMARHLFRWAAVQRLLRERLQLVLGFGLGCTILLWVPILNFFFLPYAIVAGTLLFCALREAGALPARE